MSKEFSPTVYEFDPDTYRYYHPTEAHWSWPMEDIEVFCAEKELSGAEVAAEFWAHAATLGYSTVDYFGPRTLEDSRLETLQRLAHDISDFFDVVH